MKITLTGIMLGLTITTAAAAFPPFPRAGISTEAKTCPRVLKVFDFNERALGNYDSLPMRWKQIVEPGYPRFLEARFDETIGHDAPPSFHMPLGGGNLGASFIAPEIPVIENSAYRITAWVRADNLSHGGADVSAGYLGQNLRPIPDTEVHGALIRHAGPKGPWQRVQIDLPPGPRHARWISLSCRALQAVPDEAADSATRSLVHHDARGAAWFDDICVIRMPEASLSLDAPDAIYFDDGRPEARVRIVDHDGRGLSMKLALLDADGRVVHNAAMSVALAMADTETFTAPALKPGFYRFRLEVNTPDEPLVAHERAFVVLSADARDNRRGNTGFGVVLDRNAIDHPNASRKFIDILQPDFAKIPVWRSDMSDEHVVAGAQAFDRMVQSLHHRNVGLVGVLEAPPASLAGQYEKSARSLVDVLASDPGNWRPYLALVLTRYGSWMKSWQIGADQSRPPADGPTLQQAIAQTADEIRRLIGPSRITVPCSIEQPASESPDDDVIVFTQDAGRPAESFSRMLAEHSVQPGRRTWATLHPLDERYDRLWRLSDFARGLLIARCAGVETIFAKLPWRNVEVGGEKYVEPTEELVILEAVSRLLADFRAAEPIRMAPGVESWLLSDSSDGRAAIVAWTEGQPETPRETPFDLGEDCAVFDMWGRRQSCPRQPDGNMVALGVAPVIILIRDPAQARLCSSFAIEDAVLAPEVGWQERVVRLRNFGTGRLRGRLSISGPRGWKFQPQTMSLDLQAGEAIALPFRISLPSNQACGRFSIMGQIHRPQNSGADIVMRTEIGVEARGLHVEVAAFREGDVIRIMQRITNETAEVIDLRSSLVTTAAPRQSRSIPNLNPGETVLKQYDLRETPELAGKIVRLSVEQVGGPLRHHELVNLK